MASNEERDTCPICQDLIEKTNCATTSCGHKFHLDCLLKSIITYNNKNCPICRATIVPDGTSGSGGAAAGPGPAGAAAGPGPGQEQNSWFWNAWNAGVRLGEGEHGGGRKRNSKTKSKLIKNKTRKKSKSKKSKKSKRSKKTKRSKRSKKK